MILLIFLENSKLLSVLKFMAQLIGERLNEYFIKQFSILLNYVQSA